MALEEGFVRLTEAFRLLHRSEAGGVPIPEPSVDVACESLPSALGGARAVVSAIGLEAVAALCVGGVWLICRILG